MPCRTLFPLFLLPTTAFANSDVAGVPCVSRERSPSRPDQPRTYPPAPIAASVVIYSTDDHAVLLIRRRFEPYKGKYAFPGGYMDMDREDIYETAVRELSEETGISVGIGELRLIDVRSSPSRDPRGHVVDVGFLCVVKASPRVRAQTSEAVPEWFKPQEVDALDLAFDHMAFWQATRSYLQAHVLNEQ